MSFPLFASPSASSNARAARGEAGSLTVGYTSGTLNVVTTGAVRYSRERHPGVALRLVEMDAAVLEARLDAGDLDVGLVCTPVNNAAFVTEIVHREPIVPALSDGHALAATKTVRLASESEESFLLHDRALRPSFRDLAVSLCRSAGFTPHVVQEAATQAALVGLVAAGLGVSLVCWSASTAAPSGVVFRPLKGDTLTVDIVAAWRRADASAFVQDWVEAARAAGVDTAVTRPVPVE